MISNNFEWLLDDINDSYKLITNAQNLLANAMQQGEFIFGMNKYRLIGLSLNESKAKIKSTWYRQIDLSLNNLSQIVDKKLNSNLIVIKLIVDIIIFIVNFIIQRKFIFVGEYEKNK